MKKIISLLFLFIVVFSCKKEIPFDLKKQNELTDFSERIFSQKKINSKEVLHLIELNTVTKLIDTAKYNRTPKATIYADNAAKSFFQVFEYPKNVITAMCFYKNGKQIHVAEYYDNGTIMCKFKTSRDGIRNGKYECYYKNGGIRSKGEYLNDERIGMEIEYDSIGNVTYEFDHNKG